MFHFHVTTDLALVLYPDPPSLWRFETTAALESEITFHAALTASCTHNHIQEYCVLESSWSVINGLLSFRALSQMPSGLLSGCPSLSGSPPPYQLSPPPLSPSSSSSSCRDDHMLTD